MARWSQRSMLVAFWGTGIFCEPPSFSRTLFCSPQWRPKDQQFRRPEQQNLQGRLLKRMVMRLKSRGCDHVSRLRRRRLRQQSEQKERLIPTYAGAHALTYRPEVRSRSLTMQAIERGDESDEGQPRPSAGKKRRVDTTLDSDEERLAEVIRRDHNETFFGEGEGMLFGH